MPIVKVLNNKILIHNRNLSKYSNKYLTWAAGKLKLPLPKNANTNDITRRFYVKYISDPNNFSKKWWKVTYHESKMQRILTHVLNSKT